MGYDHNFDLFEKMRTNKKEQIRLAKLLDQNTRKIIESV
jgi:hypothetical protein